jgi:hypothetical protein
MKGPTGSRLTCTLVMADGLVHPLTVVVTMYWPACKVLMLFMAMACEAEENPLGPCQL